MSDNICANYTGPNCPTYQTSGSAGCDLVAEEDAVLQPLGRAAVSTELKMEIPAGYVGMVCPRSGLALKSGVTVLNAPGIIDSDYRGVVKVILVNLSNQEYVVKKGDRIAQLILTTYSQCHFHKVDDLSSDTARGAGGFGSTGV
jgi:dUTP pyrophosphatase